MDKNRWPVDGLPPLIPDHHITRPKQKISLDEVVRFFEMFAHPVRLRILTVLAYRSEVQVNQLAKALRLPQSTISRHLGQLKESGLAQVRVQGSSSYYRLGEPWPGFIGHIMLLDLFEWKRRVYDVWGLDDQMLRTTLTPEERVWWWRTSGRKHRFPTAATVVGPTADQVLIRFEPEGTSPCTRKHVDITSLVKRR